MMGYSIATIGVVSAFAIIWLVRRDRLHVNHGLSWIAVAILLFFLGVAPAVFDFLALRLGIGYPPTLALSLGIILLTIKILLMDIERSRLEIRIQRLTQRVAIFEAEYKDQKANTDTQGLGSPREDKADKPPPLRAS